MAAIIKAVQRTRNGEIVFAYIDDTSGIMRGVTLTTTNASSLATQLLDAVAGEEEDSIRDEIAALRRDHQQLLAALQEVARKAAKLDMIEISAPVTIHGDHVIAKSLADQLKSLAVHNGVQPC